ncbi:hypothetical protein SULPSESMR1_02049 [Pseudosulfitobacter pseudonitzschiae]|uniref:Dihydroorotate dehydrogenase n=2 Tax=Rhodobacterales TaxID=204455 RepID=A0A221K1F8_9RHOB|nr:hypothetical protein SULPSESMR1_02049 [Pseudosulfitobacter pseudonitzschiae]
MTDAVLDAWLQDVPPPPVPDALMARVLDAGLAAQPAPGGFAAPVPLWQRLTRMLGGWQGMGGLAVATCAGFWIGISPPQYLPDAALSLLGVDAVFETADTTEITAYGWVVDEGTETDG